MNEMLVGINYTDGGSRVITCLSYRADRNVRTFEEMMKLYKEQNDEAYIVPLDPTHKDFINEIVTKGCRL